MPLNIAEGAREYSANEKVRFYQMARTSAIECAGIFDVCLRLKLINEQQYKQGRELLIRIVAMLTKMAKDKTEIRNSGTGSFTKKPILQVVCV